MDPLKSAIRTRLLAGLIVGLSLSSGAMAQAVQAESDAGRPFSPAGLMIEGLLVDPAAPDTVYLSVASGLFKSTDGGQTWTWSGRGLEARDLDALISDPSRPGTLYVLGHDRSEILFGSTDGGTSWRRLGEIPVGYPSALGRDLAIDGAGTLYAVLGGILFSTSDRGATWAPMHDFKAPIQSLAISPAVPGTLCVATSAISGGGVERPAQIHRSEDGGRTWKEIGGEILPPDLGRQMGYGTIFLGVAATRPETIYAGIVGKGQGIYRSADGGASWSRLALGQPGDYLELRALTVDSADPATLYVAYENRTRGSARPRVAVSHDGGTTWRNRDEGLSSGEPRLLAVGSSKGVLFAADFSGSLQISTEKQPWKYLIRRPFDGMFSMEGKVRFRPGAPSFVYTLLAGEHWKSTDGGKTWAAFSGGPGSPSLSDLAVDATDPNLLYGAGRTGVFRSRDGGETWTPVRRESAHVLALPQPGTIVAGGCGIARSTDGGSTWKEVLPCQGASPYDRRDIQRLRIDAAAPNDLYATAYGGFGASRSVYRSRDRGATWEPVAGAGAVARDPRQPKTLYAFKGKELVKSTDDGAAWTTIGSLEEFGAVGEISDLVVDPAKPETLYVFLSSVLKLTRDGGRTWESPLPLHANVAALIPHPTVPHLFYVVGSDAIYEMRLEAFASGLDAAR
ncbi:MAG: sialidase family protein [Acidobacteriota bacterium]